MFLGQTKLVIIVINQIVYEVIYGVGKSKLMLRFQGGFFSRPTGKLVIYEVIEKCVVIVKLYTTHLNTFLEIYSPTTRFLS